MVRYVLGRLIGVAFVLTAVSMIIFAMMHAVPGGPFDTTQTAEMPIPEHIRAALMAKYDLDKPLHIQYVAYMSSLLHGDLGISFRYGEPVTDFIARSWPVTIQLGSVTLLIALSLGLPLGVIAAVKRNTWIDYVASVIVVTCIVLPTFVVAIFMIVIFSVQLRWLPTGGWGTPQQMIMPVAAYVLGPLATIARYTRASMIEALSADYVRTARAKGLRERAVIMRHAFKNAMIPILTVIGPLVVWMVIGSFFIETIFRIPGIGNQITMSIYNRDYPVIMALTMLWCTAVALAYLATDLLYGVVDPRVRVGR
jgi:ABC-type dipeptide/oligopeptide/nickel transport system permease component